jgi:peptidoglycan/LPS O-acetylase OafA/YrhL
MDAARLLAAVGIICLHTFGISPKWGYLGDLGRFAVPFFVLTAVVLTGEGLRRKGDRPFGTYVWSRFRRIYVPFLLATVLYILLRDAKHFLRPASTELVPLNLGLFVSGSAHHLWFLPYILIVSVLVFPVLRVLLRCTARTQASVGACCLVLGLIQALLPNPVDFIPGENLICALSYLGLLAWNASAAVLWGITLVCWLPKLRTWWAPRVWLGPLCLAAAVITAIANMNLNRLNLLEHLAGVALFLAALVPWPIPGLATLAGLGRYAYRIYILHVAVILGLDVFVIRNRETVGLATLMAIFVTATVVTIALSLLGGKPK